MFRNSIRGAFLLSVRLGAVVAAGMIVTSPAFAAGHEGKAVKVGNGTARLVVETDASGKPTSIGISMTADALEGLPTELNKASAEGSWDYELPMPEGVTTGYSEVVIDWNPHGHPPPHVYTVPHFDFHFYMIPPAQIKAIKFTGPKDPAIQVSDKGLVPTDYQVIPDTAVNEMGVHAIDMTAPEFHGKPFTATFIYGYDKGNLIFLEPMITRAFLQTDPDVTMPVKTPEHYSSPGFYPTNYSVKYDSSSKRYMIEFGGLKASQ